MHISEGILPAPLLFCGAAFTFIGVAIGLKKLDYRSIPQAGILAACFFVVSFIHIPFGPVGLHLTLTGLIGVILGWSSFPIILVSLILQIPLHRGGITTLGVNTLIMALPAVIVSLPARSFIHKSSFFAKAIIFTAGFSAFLLSALLMAVFLFFTGEHFHTFSFFVFTGQLPFMIVEGIITVFGVAFLQKVQPSMLSLKHAEKEKAQNIAKKIHDNKS